MCPVWCCGGTDSRLFASSASPQGYTDVYDGPLAAHMSIHYATVPKGKWSLVATGDYAMTVLQSMVVADAYYFFSKNVCATGITAMGACFLQLHLTCAFDLRASLLRELGEWEGVCVCIAMLLRPICQDGKTRMPREGEEGGGGVATPCGGPCDEGSLLWLGPGEGGIAGTCFPPIQALGIRAWFVLAFSSHCECECDFDVMCPEAVRAG